MKHFTIIKKNRKYFAARTDGYKCKILIDANSENLQPGEHNLEVDDISVRSKYGTDLIFKLSASVEEIKDAGICTLQHDRYNVGLIERCRELGGKWDRDTGTWVFSGLVAAEVEELDAIYNSDLIAVELTADDDIRAHRSCVEFCGYTIARAFGRDSGAKLSEGVSQISGRVTSGGSVKNWNTCIAEGTVLRMYLPKELLQSHSDGFSVRVLEAIHRK